VGLSLRFSLLTLTTVCFTGFLQAAPMLRLASATVGPISVSPGANGPAQTVEAYNAGDGALNLSLKSSVEWIAATAGAPRACTGVGTSGTCIPLQIALNTSGLAAGMQTGIVTVSDPNAVDAPQTITVTVQVGGGVPAVVDAWVAPGGSRDVSFAANSYMYGRATTQDGGQWLSLALDGIGSFRFVYPYRVHIQTPDGMASGVYNGSLVTSGSAFAADNRTIPVTMHVTTQPIADTAVNRLQARVAQGAPPQPAYIPVTNAGQGSLTIQGVSISGGSGITGATYPGGAALTLDPGSLATGTYSGTVSIATNAANTLAPIPVDFTVVPKGPPLIPFQNVVDAAIFAPGDSVSPGDIVTAFGEQFSFDAAASGPAPPMALKVGNTQVLVNGQPAPLYYVSYNQINFEIPMETPLGTGVIQIVREDQKSNPVSLSVAPRAPRLLQIGSFGAIVNTDGSLPMPVGTIPGLQTHPAKAGDVLTIYAIGMGPTSPAVSTGAPAPSAEPLARITAMPAVNFGGGFAGILVTPLFAGLTPTCTGLYQVNVTVPEGLPKGIVYVSVDFPDSASNAVQIAIQ
jgi:uncharacterized protein (TIGR03437 family)